MNSCASAEKRTATGGEAATGAGQSLSGLSRIFTDYVFYCCSPCLPFLDQVLVIIQNCCDVSYGPYLVPFAALWLRW